MMEEKEQDEPYVEGEPELDSVSDYIIEDDSDEEFIPGKKQKRKSGKTNKRGSIKATRKIKQE